MRIRSAWVVAGLMMGLMAVSVEAQTHLGQAASSHVLLHGVFTGPGGCNLTSDFFEFQRVLPDGTAEPNLFRVPAGQVLVVTDVDWQYFHAAGSSAAGTIQTLRLYTANLSSSSSYRQGMESTITLSSAGEGGASESMTTGFTMSSGARLCPEIVPGPSFGLTNVIVRGYLVRDR